MLKYAEEKMYELICVYFKLIKKIIMVLYIKTLIVAFNSICICLIKKYFLINLQINKMQFIKMLFHCIGQELWYEFM